jgi:hypothetical protein
VAGAGFDGGIRGGLIWSIAIRIAVIEAVSVRGAVRKLARPELYKLAGEAFSSSMSKGGRDLGLWVVEALYRPGDARVGSDSRSGGGQKDVCTVLVRSQHRLLLRLHRVEPAVGTLHTASRGYRSVLTLQCFTT